MKKYLLSFAFLVMFGGYAALQYLNSAGASYAASNTPSQQVATTQTQVQTQPAQQPSQPIAITTTDSSAENASDGGSDDASENARQAQPAQATTQTQTPQTNTPVQPQTQPVAVAQTPVAKPQGQYTDGTYTGPVENAFYGYVQVQATVSGGKLANVTFLQYPNDRSTSRFINQQAMPILISEAIQAQSANVNGVSGASDTSAAFQQSLASALSQAKA